MMNCIDSVNDSEGKTVTELTTRKVISYEGEFIQIYSEGIIYRKGDKIFKKQLESKNESSVNSKNN